jgi:hypothetical protein
VGGAAEIHGLEIERVADRGLRAVRGAHVTATAVRVGAAAGDGVGVGEGAVATLSDVRIGAGSNGGITVVDGTLTLDGAQIDGPRRHGLLASRAVVNLRDLSIQDSETRGISLLSSQGTLRMVTLTGNANVGLQVTDPSGPVLVDGGTVMRNGTTGIAVDGADAGLVTLRGLVVGETRVGDGDLAEGVHLYRGEARLEDVVSTGNGGAGVLAEDATPDVRGGRLAENGGPGLVAVDAPGEVVVDGTTVEANHAAGVLVLGGRARLAGVVVARTARGDGTADGIVAGNGAMVEVSGGESRENAGHGLAAFVRGVLRDDGTAVSGNGGYGAYAACDGSRVDAAAATRFADNALGDRNHCP